jgi:hypothetical protein
VSCFAWNCSKCKPILINTELRESLSCYVNCLIYCKYTVYEREEKKKKLYCISLPSIRHIIMAIIKKNEQYLLLQQYNGKIYFDCCFFFLIFISLYFLVSLLSIA